MFGNGRSEIIISTMVGTASVIVGVVITGRALHSQILMNLESTVPFLGFFTRPLRAVVNQVYDVSAQD